MIAACKEKVREHFNPAYVSFVDADVQFFFEEKKAEGRGRAYFCAQVPTLKLKAKDKAPMVWSFSNPRCAEGAFITFDGENKFRLHIIELKSRLTQGMWKKAMEQFKGMFLTSLAVSKLIDVGSFSDVICYVAYTEDAMTVDKSADMILLKTFVGEENPVSRNSEWIAEEFELPLGVRAQIRKGQRGGEGNVDFGVV